MKNNIHRNRSIILMFVLFSLMLSGCTNSKVIVNEQKEEVTATVTSVEEVFVPPTYYFSPATNTSMPFFYPNEYNVTVTYDDLSQTFNDKSLYNSVNVGDTIQVILHEVVDDEGKTTRELLLP